ncbi:MAG: BamA/TamA family outer membrane protein [Lentisphaeria bacterium]|nr:BamA/TamA family outer membrane protein [Lentisphaeria bacterium]
MRTPFGNIVARTMLLSAAVLAAGAAAADLAYRVHLEGGSWGLRRRLRPILYSVELQEYPPATPGLLRRRAEEDVDRLRRALRSLGYYDAAVELHLDLESTPIRVRFVLAPGPAYVLRDVRIVGAEGTAAPLRLPRPAEIGLLPGARFEERLVADAQERLLEWFRDAGYPTPEVTDRSVRVEHDDRSVHIVFALGPGTIGRFGVTSVEGLERVREKHIRRLLPWREGDRFSASRLREARQTLSASGLFSSIRLQTETQTGTEEDAPAATVDVRLALAERPRRTVRVGAGYTTGPGPDLRLGWERRNLAGNGETLRLATHLSTELYTAEAQFRKPAFLRPAQNLVIEALGAREETIAYISGSLGLSGMVERRLTRRWTAAAGLALRRVGVEDPVGASRFALVSTPFELTYDSSDHPLDPTRGMRLRLSTAPTVDAADPDIAYLRQRLEWRGYLRLSMGGRLGLATRLAAGHVIGEDHGDIPADERFHAGGGGSIRGYGYKDVGPRRDGESVGGRSLAESSVELRWRVTESFGVVVFVDGGNAFRGAVPRLGEGWRWGTGAGVRYFTPIGPIRLDVATPLNADEESARVRFYVSIGQAF